VSLHLLHIKVGSILVGGAVTGVIVGIGAQSTLSNLFAGVVLFTLRPFSVGQTILIRTYLFGGTEYSGTVLDINWYYTVLLDGGQRRILPNSSVIISAITIVSDSGMQLYTVPLPYSVSVHGFEEELEQVTSGQAKVSIKEFEEQTYTVQVKLPSGVDRDLLREAIRKHRTLQ
jgi:small conductance mechanosensitive channel